MEENSLWRIYQKNISTVEKSIQPVLLEILKSKDKTGMPVLSELKNIIMWRSKNHQNGAGRTNSRGP